jgi:hypothetical protein
VCQVAILVIVHHGRWSALYILNYQHSHDPPPRHGIWLTLLREPRSVTAYCLHFVQSWLYRAPNESNASLMRMHSSLRYLRALSPTLSFMLRSLRTLSYHSYNFAFQSWYLGMIGWVVSGKIVFWTLLLLVGSRFSTVKGSFGKRTLILNEGYPISLTPYWSRTKMSGNEREPENTELDESLSKLFNAFLVQWGASYSR